MANMMAGAAWGWHMEQGVQMARLVFSGLFEKHPNLKLISGHWGEFVPMFIERLDVFGRFSELPHPFSYYYRKNVYVGPSDADCTHSCRWFTPKQASGFICFILRTIHTLRWKIK